RRRGTTNPLTGQASSTSIRPLERRSGRRTIASSSRLTSKSSPARSLLTSRIFFGITIWPLAESVVVIESRIFLLDWESNDVLNRKTAWLKYLRFEVEQIPLEAMLAQERVPFMGEAMDGAEQHDAQSHVWHVVSRREFVKTAVAAGVLATTGSTWAEETRKG